VIAPNARDEASNEYRVVENVNTNFTIHQKALTGVGFGQKFFVIVPLPDISFFVWYEYITHNSIMWVWMQTGFFGFMSLLIMVGSTIMIGFHAYDRMPPGDEKAIGLTALLYVVMHFVYAYVDMSWENQSMILVGASIGIIGSLQWVMSRPIPAPRRRYRWQTLQPVQPVLLEDNE
jgi:O-antigen ligase